MDTPILQALNVDKAFGGTHALRGASFELRSGEIHALVGENGAGKSTLIKILSGALRPDRAQIFYQGREVEIPSPRAAQEMGIATVYQEPLLYPELTAVENIFMGREIRGRFGDIDYVAQRRRAEELFRILVINPNFLNQRLGRLSLAQAQLVLIARAMAFDSRVMIFDEPTAILTQQEAAHLFDIMGRLKRQGVGIIYISHRLEEVFHIADRVTVMRDGEVRGTFRVDRITEDRVIELMAGRELHRLSRREATVGPQSVLKVEGLSREPAFRQVSFTLHRGEILGFFGLVGSGRSEVMQAIAGIVPPVSGKLYLDEQALQVSSPRDALKRGIVYLPEDRKVQGLFHALPVRYNLSVSILGALRRLALLIDRQAEARMALQAVSGLSIKTAGLNAPASSLSGGNQQKVLLGRWLAAKPQVLILDEPTRGVDVGAKEEIHRRIFELAKEGVSIIVVSSELPEILKLSDRIVVMREGAVTGEFPADLASEETVLRAAMGRLETNGRSAGLNPPAAKGDGSAPPVAAALSQDVQSGRAATAQVAANESAPARSPAAGEVEQRPRRIAPWLGSMELTVLGLILLLGVGLSMASPQFLTSRNISNLLFQVASIGIIGIGMTMIIVTAGIDVSIGSIMGVTAVVMGKAAVAGYHPVLVALAGLLTGGLLGALNGLLIVGGRIPPIIATLGTMNLLRASVFTLLGGKWIAGIPAGVRSFSLTRVLGIPIPVWVMLLLGALFTYFLARRPAGRHLYAVGGNRDAAAIAGINVGRTLFTAYLVTGVLVGLAGFTYIGRAGLVQTNTGQGYELAVIAATVLGGTSILGGRGTVIGTLLGALLVAMLRNGLILLNVPALWEGVIVGTLILLAVVSDLLRKRGR